MQAEALDQISIVPFKFKHYKHLIDMLESQQFPHIADIKFKQYPKIGYLALLGNMPIAAGFLRKVEGKIGQLDGFTTNAYAGALLRNRAINIITDTLISDAKKLKLEYIMVLSEDKSVIERAIQRGFKLLKSVVLAARL